MNDFQKTAKELLDFIEKSPTCFHAVANIGAMLEEAGYVRLRENEEWKLVKGGKYYTERNDSSVIAFAVPTGTVKGFHMAAAHSDSPCFKVKEKPELTVEDHYMRLNTEKYGGMILSTWMDRPLSVAGRLAVRGTDGIQSRLVNIDRDLCVIPNVAIHMNREMNKGVEYNPQVDMLPLFADVAFDTDAAGTAETADGPQEKPALLGLAAEAAGVDAEAILGEDLFLYTRHVETVVLLSHKKADSYIHIDVEFGEGEGKIPVDSIAKRAEAYKPKEKVTYKMIKEYIEAKYGFKVHTAYIAEVKRNLGLPMYDAPNAVEELKQPRKHPTPEKVEAIKDALRYFAVI